VISAVNIEGAITTIAWNIVTGASYFEIDVQLDGGEWTQESQTYPTSPATWGGLGEGSRKYRIRACNVDNVCSENSPESDAVVTESDNGSEVQGSIYYFLNPNWVGAVASFYAYEDNTVVSVEGVEYTLNKGQGASHTVQAQGSKIFANKAFSIGTDGLILDMPVPAEFLGQDFAGFMYYPAQKLHFLSPNADAEVAITTYGRAPQILTLSLQAGQVTNFEWPRGSRRISIHSEEAIVVSTSNDRYSGMSYSVPPVENELWGIVSRGVYVLSTVYGSDVIASDSLGEAASFILNVNQYKRLTNLSGSQGIGPALHLSGSQSIAAFQFQDGDTRESSAFWPSKYFATDYILPVGTQYAAMVCNQANTSITLYSNTGEVLDSSQCESDGAIPGKSYFGSEINGVNIAAGSRIVASKPIYLMYEVAATDAETNLLGYNHQIAALVSISYPGSGEGDITTSTDEFIASATPTASNEGNIQTVEFSLNGIDWFEATLVDGSYQYDFGNLPGGTYYLSIRITGTDNSVSILTLEVEVVIAPVELEYQYDALGRLIKVTDPTNGNRDYDYDAAGNRTKVGIEQ
jgi:YD repeat-containing protein